MSKLRLAILISGRGTNMGAILEAATAPAYPATASLVLSNRPKAGGLAIAEQHTVPTKVIDHKRFGTDREAFERQMDQALRDAQIEIIALAGFMRVLTPWFVRKWDGRMINIHPSLLPKYPGLHTHQRAIDAGDTEAGCSVHWVTEGVDEGTVIEQAALPILPGDTAESLASRILPLEHALYPRALAKACLSLT